MILFVINIENKEVWKFRSVQGNCCLSSLKYDIFDTIVLPGLSFFIQIPILLDKYEYKKNN